MKSHDGERKSRATHRSKVIRPASTTACKKNKRHGCIAAIQVICDPPRALSLRFQLIEGTESVKMAWFFDLD